MGESFSAQLSTGIATYSVPFSLPAARGGAQPSLTRSSSVARLSDGTSVYSLVTNGPIGFYQPRAGDSCSGLSPNENALVLVRLATNGDCLWAKRYGGYDNANFQISKINRIPLGSTPTGFVVAVPPLGTINFEGTGSTSTGEIVGRFTNAGVAQAVQLVDDAQAGTWIIESIASDATGNVYLGGRAQYNLHLNNMPGFGVFVAKYTAQLGNTWARFYGGMPQFASIQGFVDTGVKIDVTGSVVGLLAPITQAATFRVATITPKANATAFAIARLSTSNGDGQAATGGYPDFIVDSNSDSHGMIFGANGTLLIALRTAVEIDAVKYPGGVVYAGFDAQLKAAWVKSYSAGWPVGIGFNAVPQNAVLAGHIVQSLDFGLGALMPTGGFVVALGAP